MYSLVPHYQYTIAALVWRAYRECYDDMLPPTTAIGLPAGFLLALQVEESLPSCSLATDKTGPEGGGPYTK